MAEPSIKGWIWPRDIPFQGRRWARKKPLFRDIFFGQGPDIFIGRLDTLERQPTKSRWSRWADLYPDPNDRGLPAMPWADRGRQRYDFLTRRYTNFYPGMWSKTEWASDNLGRLYQNAYWDADGNRHALGSRNSSPRP